MVDTDVDPNAGSEPVKRKRGRPKGSGKKQQAAMREPMRETLHEDDAGFTYKPEEEGSRLGIAKEHIPDGMEYLWVTASVFGQPQPQRLARFQRQGWAPVPASRHDGMFMPKGYQGQIEVDGLVLHERSKKICDMARAHERKKAIHQRQTKEAQLLGGDINSTLDSRHPSALKTNKINRTYERIEIPED